MSRITYCLLPLLLTTFTLTARGASPDVTLRTLLDEMTDLARLTERPDPPFTCRQFSSYDRRSRAPDQGGVPTDGWFANGDAGNFLRTEQNGDRTEHVLMDTAGPGAIVRIWSANPKGTLRVYLDGRATPELTLPMAGLLTGELANFPSPITGMRSRGCNSYFPIPYASHCKVTCDEQDFYYHINYRTYPQGTTVESYSTFRHMGLMPRVNEIAGALRAPRSAGRPDHPSWLPAASIAGTAIPPNQAITLGPLAGPAAISGLCARLMGSDPERALRETVLTITFDDVTAVHAPLGDFFGSAPGLSPYESLPMGITMDGVLWSQWRMPFRNEAAITLRNLGDAPVQLSMEVKTVPYEWTDRSMYFHARWRQDRQVPTRPMVDWNYLDAQGAGVFVGAAFYIANPVRNWWGEGDEKIYVDGESFPSHFGTGTEDYFGYAWCDNAPFTHAYHNQPRCDGPGNYGFTANNRWHVLDRIPFDRSFRFDMELWHWDEKSRVDMAVTAYWYARPGTTDTFARLAAKDVQWQPMPPYVMFKVPGAIEGEELVVLEKRTAARVDPHSMKGASGDQTLLYHYDTAAGDRLALGFDAREDGRYRIYAKFLKSRDFGIVQWSLNNTKLGEPIDLYDPEPMLSDEVELGVVELRAGQNRLIADIVGTNEESIYQRYMLGLDYIRLERVP